MRGITKRAIAGGKARAWQEKKEALLRHDVHKFCKNCGRPILARKRVIDTARKKFCNRSCAARYNNRLRLTQLILEQ